MNFKYIDMGIAARNEEALIGETLTSLHRQELDGRYRFGITVIASNCTDATAEVAERTIASFEPRPEIDFRVVEKREPGKVAAINHALAISESDDFMYGDGDMTVSPHCLTRIADTLHIPGIVVSGAISRQIISQKIAGTSLGNLHRTRQLHMEASRQTPVPMGRMMAFRRILLDFIPETALAEDRYVTLSALKQFGERAVRCAEGAYVYGIATQTWEDYIELGRRYKTLSDKLFQDHSELKVVYDTASNAARNALPPKEEIERRLFAAMDAEGIPRETYSVWQFMRRAILDSATAQRVRLGEDGTWSPLASTKSKIN